MLYSNNVNCADMQEFEMALEDAIDLSINTDLPIRVSGHCSPLSKGGDGLAGIMFSVFETFANGGIKQTIYHVRANFPLDHAVFDVSYKVQDRLRASGKLIGFADWEEDIVTHVIAIPWNNHDWEYGFIGTTAQAIHEMFRFGGSYVRETQPTA